MNRCPTTEQLERWLQQPGDGAEAQALAAHVDVCPHCQSALATLTADPAASQAPFGAPTLTLDDPAPGRLEEAPPDPVGLRATAPDLAIDRLQPRPGSDAAPARL